MMLESWRGEMRPVEPERPVVPDPPVDPPTDPEEPSVDPDPPVELLPSPDITVEIDRPMDPEHIIAVPALLDSEVSWVIRDEVEHDVAEGEGTIISGDVLRRLPKGFYTAEFTETSLEGETATSEGRFEISTDPPDPPVDPGEPEKPTDPPVDPGEPEKPAAPPVDPGEPQKPTDPSPNPGGPIEMDQAVNPDQIIYSPQTLDSEVDTIHLNNPIKAAPSKLASNRVAAVRPKTGDRTSMYPILLVVWSISTAWFVNRKICVRD